MDNILEIKDLIVRYETEDGVVEAVNSVNLSLRQGAAVGLVGETGAGKTTLAKSILRLIQWPPGRIVSGQIFYNGKDLTAISEEEMCKIRGNDISMIFQDPMTALNPVMTIGKQISEVIAVHEKVSSAEAEEKMKSMLTMVGIDPQRAEDYPHQFSGGMKQRVVIAIALACNPNLLVADEPTTALDVTIQAQVLDLIKNLREKLGTSLLLITHDLGVVANMCDRIAVMYAGKVVEYGTTDDIFYRPSHEYTKGLLRSIPRLDEKEKTRLVPIEGSPVDMLNPPAGCPFAPRCESCMKICLRQMPEYTDLSDIHYSACWLLQKAEFEKAQGGNN